MKLRHDFAGHYNRPDIFQLHINRAAPQLYRIHNESARTLANSDTDALAEPQTPLVTSQRDASEKSAADEKPPGD